MVVRQKRNESYKEFMTRLKNIGNINNIPDNFVRMTFFNNYDTY